MEHVDGVRITLGPPPVDDFDPKSMIGTTVTVERGGPAAGRVLDAWIHEGMIVALVTVDGPMKELLEEKNIGPDVLNPEAVARQLREHPEPKLIPLRDLEAWRDAPSNTASVGHEKVCTCGWERDPECPRHATFVRAEPDPGTYVKHVNVGPSISRDGMEAVARYYGESGEYPSYTVNKYGGIYSMKGVILGGFRTRYRVRWLRVILRCFRPAALADGARALLEMETAAQDMEDYMRKCPHKPEWIHREDEVQAAWCTVCQKGMP